jgi:glycosyltransferase involved in cell wall biosynthesis
MRRWHIVTGEYPPQPGGVSDYTGLVARELAKAGDEVDVWAPQCAQSQKAEAGIRVHRLRGRFGLPGLAALDRAVTAAPNDRVLVEYVPHAFGLKGMNLPFCLWLFSRRRWSIDVMFHEVAFPRRALQPLTHNLLGEISTAMARLVARSANRIFVSCLAWERLLRGLIRRPKKILWMPVPSTIPLVNDIGAVQSLRTKYSSNGLLAGHFGTYGANLRASLEIAIPGILGKTQAHVLLLGRGSTTFRDTLAARYPAFSSRLCAADSLVGEALSVCLSACDVLIQPYPDGISTRRTSAMAALAHARPLVTTSGVLTEPLWIESHAVATVPAGDSAALAPLVVDLLNDVPTRKELSLAGARLYRKHFDLCHTINFLRASDADCHSKLDRP